MENKDYGQYVQSMRKSRGLTQDQVVKASGVSISTVHNLENSGEKISIRASSLDAILTVIAMHGYLSAAEIKVVARGAERTYDSLERINTRAEFLIHEQSGDRRTRPPANTEPSREHRVLSAFRIMEEAGQGDPAIAMLEAMAKQASDQIASENRTPKHTPPGER